MPETRYIRAVNDALKEEMERDKNVFIAGEDVAIAGGSFSATRGLYEQFGKERVVDTPIAESAIVGLAIGAALTGLRPVVEIMFNDFVTCAMDQIVNQAAKIRYMFGGKPKLPLVIRMPCGAGMNAGPQHSQSLEAWFTHIPGLKVVMPSTVYDVKREGKDVTIVATSQMVHKALKAAQVLSAEKIEAEVIDPRTLTPLDKNLIINSVKKTGRLVIAHEAVKFCGFGAEIAAIVSEEAFRFLKAPVKRVAAPFTQIPFSKPLEQFYLPKDTDIIQAVKEIVNK